MTTFPEFSAKLEHLQREWSGVEGRRRLERVAQKTKGDVGEAVKGDLGDLSMSGWRRKKPISINGRYDVVSNTSFRIAPHKSAVGPMRVLEEGRKPGSVPRSSRRRRRPVVLATPWGPRSFTSASPMSTGRTQGKGTWSDATMLMRARTAERVHDELVKAMREVF